MLEFSFLRRSLPPILTFFGKINIESRARHKMATALTAASAIEPNDIDDTMFAEFRRRHLQGKDDLCILVTGRTGAGKSALVNSLLGTYFTEESDSPSRLWTNNRGDEVRKESTRSQSLCMTLLAFKTASTTKIVRISV